MSVPMLAVDDLRVRFRTEKSVGGFRIGEDYLSAGVMYAPAGAPFAANFL